MTASEIYQEAVELQRLGWIEDVVAKYREVVRLDSHYYPAWYSQDCALEIQGNFAAALACFGRAVALAPDHGESHHN